MIYYVTYFIWLTLATLIEQGRSRARALQGVLLHVSSLISVLFMGFRERVGGDWFAYLDYHHRAARSSLSDALAMNDPGYMFLDWAGGHMGLEVWATNLVCAILLVYGVRSMAVWQRYPNLFFLSCAPYLLMIVGMGYSRQSAAVGLVALSITLSYRKRRLLSIAVAPSSLLFHKSAVMGVMLVLLGLSRRRLTTAVIGVIGAAGLYYYATFGAIEVAQRGYIEAEYNSAGAFIRTLQLALCGGWFLLFMRQTTPADIRRTFTIFAITAILMFAALFVSPSSTLIDRFALYLLPFQGYVLAAAPTAFRRGPSEKIVVIAIIALNLALFFVWLLTAVHQGAWDNYQNYLITGSPLLMR